MSVYNLGNEEILGILETLNINSISMYITEGILPNTGYTITPDSLPAPTKLTFENLYAISGLYEDSDKLKSVPVYIDSFDYILPDASTFDNGKYVELYIDLSTTPISIQNEAITASPSPDQGSIHRYTFANYDEDTYYPPWDDFGNMPRIVSSAPSTRIYIGYLAKYTIEKSPGTAVNILHFIPQYARQGLNDYDVLILPNWMKQRDGTNYKDKIAFRNVSGGDFYDYVGSDDVILTLGDRTSTDLVKNISMVDVRYFTDDQSFPFADDNSVSAPALCTHNLDLIYNGTPSGSLRQYDLAYPYYLYFNGNNWQVKLAKQNDAGQSDMLNSSANVGDIYYDPTDQYNIYNGNYVIFLVEWGSNNLWSFPGKGAGE